jgi:glycine/D-amino acid oxidase-like deaminating enzyme
MRDYTRYSYWLETCGDDLTPRPPLDGSVDVDVAILGAGFSGLWTAYYLLKRDPSLKVALLEKEIAGFGASGRNGGWCTAGFPIGMHWFAEHYGREAARDVQFAMYDTVDEVGRVAESEGFDIDYAKGGSLRVAQGKHQLPSIEGGLKNYREFGLEDQVEYLDAQQTAERVRISGALGSLWSKNTAVIHPAKLARGLARAVERLGGTIYEGTAVTDFTTGAYPVLHTARGHARAKTIVLAGEAYLSQLPKTRRRVLPAYSLITLTEPLSPSDWEQIGWEARECVSSAAFMVNYLSKTADGRILFGGRGAPYRYASKIRDEYDRHESTHQMLQDNVRTWFPTLKDVKFTHSWGGPLGWPRDYVPTIGYDAKDGLATAYGYTGVGVATANLSGRILADLITRTDSDVTKLPFVNLRGKDWEPEPLRFLGVRYVQESFVRLDRKAEATGIPPTGKSLAERLTKH